MSFYGGYFELELGSGREYHKNCLRLNSGRNALEYVIKQREYMKIYLPYYTCDVMLNPIHRLGIEFEHYRINRELLPEFAFEGLGANEAIVITNYFGLLDEYVESLANCKHNIIIDNAQAFYAKPITGIDTFYSPRKFFGVPDGAYLYLGNNYGELALYHELEHDTSWDRCSHLIKRADNLVEEGYANFRSLSAIYKELPLRKMSILSSRILDSIEYNVVRARRRENFRIVDSVLGSRNQLKSSLDSDSVPMAYPFLSSRTDLRDRLIKQGVFIPQYWANVTLLSGKGSWESELAENLIALPIDQRYNEPQVYAMLEIIKQCLA